MGADDAQRGVHPCMPNLGLSTGVTLDDYTELKRIHLLDFRTGKKLVRWMVRATKRYAPVSIPTRHSLGSMGLSGRPVT